MKIDVITCSCEGELIRFDLTDWGQDGLPMVYMSFWEIKCCGNSRQSFLQRVKNGWLEFRGKLVHDEFCINEKKKLLELQGIVNDLVKQWEEEERKKT